MTSIGIMGDFSSESTPQTTLEPALQHAASSLGVELRSEWVPTEAINAEPGAVLSTFDALFAAPGTPQSLSGTLKGIEFARIQNKVFLGTCGGFQHAALEYARNVCGLRKAAHQEYEPEADQLVLTALPCSILGGRVMRVRLEDGSRAASVFGVPEIFEEYYCNYGINPEYENCLTNAGLVISARDDEGAPRVIELPDLRFFIASLFVPQTSSREGRPHPLILAFVAAAQAMWERRGLGRSYT